MMRCHFPGEGSQAVDACQSPRTYAVAIEGFRSTVSNRNVPGSFHLSQNHFPDTSSIWKTRGGSGMSLRRDELESRQKASAWQTQEHWAEGKGAFVTRQPLSRLVLHFIGGLCEVLALLKSS